MIRSRWRFWRSRGWAQRYEADVLITKTVLLFGLPDFGSSDWPRPEAVLVWVVAVQELLSLSRHFLEASEALCTIRPPSDLVHGSGFGLRRYHNLLSQSLRPFGTFKSSLCQTSSLLWSQNTSRCSRSSENTSSCINKAIWHPGETGFVEQLGLEQCRLSQSRLSTKACCSK